MKIAIKYCGGCRSKYDRVKTVETLREKLPRIDFCYQMNEKEYDLLILVQGCPVGCAISEEKDVEILEITPNNYMNAVKFLEEYAMPRSEKNNGKLPKVKDIRVCKKQWL